MSWIQDHSAAITGLSSIVLTGITAYYVYLTWRLLKENQELRLAAVKPQLSIYLKPYEAGINFIILCIENLGPGDAPDVRFTTNYDFRSGDETPLRDVGPFRKGLSYFGAGRKIEHYLANVIGNFDALKARPLEIVAHYKDVLGRDYSPSFVLDFAEMEHLTQIGTPPLHVIADAAKKIQQDLKNIASGRSRPHVLTETPEEYARRRDSERLSTRIRRLPEERRAELEAAVAETEQALQSANVASDVTATNPDHDRLTKKEEE